jgi:hypothetical protein
MAGILAFSAEPACTRLSASGDFLDDAGHALVTAYALLRRDAQWSVMLVNRDQQNAH